SNSRHRPPTDTVVVFWILALFAITALGALPLFFYRLDLSKLTFSTPIPVVVGIGIEVTAYAPTLAALLFVVLVPGGGGIGRRWRSALSGASGTCGRLWLLAGSTARLGRMSS